MSDGNKCAFAQVDKDWNVICNLVGAVMGKDQFIRVDKSSVAFNYIN